MTTRGAESRTLERPGRWPWTLGLSAGLVLCSAIGGCGAEYMKPEVPKTDAASAKAPEVAVLDDVQVARMAETLRHGLAESALVARRRANDPRVKELAGRILGDEGESGPTKSEASAKERSIADEVLASNFLDERARLMSLSGRTFDRDFIASQRTGLAKARGVLRNLLIPSARDQQLRRDLERLYARLGARASAVAALDAQLPVP
jgi:predicted outer membrane protein